MKRQTYESLVSWCSFSTWIPRLTDEVPGFVAGVAAQALFQNLIPFSVRKKDFDVNPGLTSPCFPHVFAHSSVVPFYLSLTSDQKLRWEISKRAKKEKRGKKKRPFTVRNITGCFSLDSGYSFMVSREPKASQKTIIIKFTAEHTLVIWLLTASSKLSWWTVCLSQTSESPPEACHHFHEDKWYHYTVSIMH